MFPDVCGEEFQHYSHPPPKGTAVLSLAPCSLSLRLTWSRNLQPLPIAAHKVALPCLSLITLARGVLKDTGARRGAPVGGLLG